MEEEDWMRGGSSRESGKHIIVGISHQFESEGGGHQFESEGGGRGLAEGETFSFRWGGAEN